MQRTLPASLPDFNQASIIVIGDIMLDRYWFGDTTRISPEAPVPIVNVASIDERLGGAGNVALNIKSLGAGVAILAAAGLDDDGKALQHLLDAAHITHHVPLSAKLRTIVKLRIISRHQQLIRADFESKLAQVDFNTLEAAYETCLKSANLVILSDYKKGTLADAQSFIQAAKRAGVPVLVDPKGTDFSIYSGCDLITPNFKEFEAVVGACPNEKVLLQKGRELLATYHIKALLVTRGESGMTLIDGDDVLHLPACAREVVDVTGAGDTVISTLGAAIAAGASLAEAAALANLAASIAISKLGAATVSAPELEASLKGTANYTAGIVNEQQLSLAVSELRAQGKRIVFTNGCFDVIHAGHVECLQLAKSLGDCLIVAVNTDESIQKLKGPHRPVNHLDHRMTVLAGLGVVDFVVPFADDTPERLLHLLKPDVLAKGGEYSIDQVVGADIVRAYGGDIRILGDKISSSTSIINKLFNNTEE